MENDSWGYLKTGLMLVNEHRFGTYNEFHHFVPEIYRTPGYPLFLGIFHGLLRIPLKGIIVIQWLMTIIASWVTFRVAQLVCPRVSYLSALIVLADPPIMIYSMMILSETLFVLLIALFSWSFVIYLKKRAIRWILLSGILLSLAVYVRPIAYFLGLGISALILIIRYHENRKRAVIQSLTLLCVVYSFIGLWHLRNYKVKDDPNFSSITHATIYSPYATGMINSYARNNLQQQGINPFGYYLNAGFESLLSLMTDPGNFKYFGSYPLRIAGKVFGYPWMIFWLIGLLTGVSQLKGNTSNQFIGVIILYFIVTSIGGAMLGCGPRFRVPMVPFIALLSAQGWDKISAKFRKHLKKNE